MIERGETGGTCVNTGCVPSKALLLRSGVACDCRVLPLAAVPRATVNRTPAAAAT